MTIRPCTIIAKVVFGRVASGGVRPMRLWQRLGAFLVALLAAVPITVVALGAAPASAGTAGTDSWYTDTNPPYPINQPFGCVAAPPPGAGYQEFVKAWRGCTDPTKPDAHDGLDIGLPCGTPLKTPFWATVISFSNQPAKVGGGPDTPTLRLDDGHDVILGHALGRYVKVGDRLAPGTLVTYSDTQGNSSGCHLHFEVRPEGGGDGTAIDPTPWLTTSSVQYADVTSTVARRPDGTMDLFVRGANLAGTPYHEQIDQAGHVLKSWEPLRGLSVLGAPNGTWNSAGTRLDVFAVGTDGRIYQDTFTVCFRVCSPYASGSWSGWSLQKGGGRAGSGSVSVARRPDGTMDLFVRGADFAGTPWHEQLDQAGNVLWSWETIPSGRVLGAPSGVWTAAGNRLDVFAVGTDGTIWHNGWNPSAWDGWQPMNDGGRAGSATVTVTRRPDSSLDLFVEGTDGSTYHEQAWGGSVLKSWEPLGGAVLGAPSGTWTADGKLLDAFAVGTDGTIWRGTYFGLWSGWYLQPGGGTAG